MDLPYPDNTILVAEVGSTAHGTGLPGKEDHDETVIFIEPASAALGVSPVDDAFMQRTQPEGSRSGPGDTDRQCYSLRKFLRLAYAGNPSVLLVFWAPVMQTTLLGDELRGLGSAFAARHVIPRYRGYMQAQISRMKGEKSSHGHGHRGGGKREELVAEHGYDTKFAMHAARLGFQGLELVRTGKLELPIPGAAGDWLRAVRGGAVPLEDFYAVVEQLDLELEAVAGDRAFPKGPRTDDINAFSEYAHKTLWEMR